MQSAAIEAAKLAGEIIRKGIEPHQNHTITTKGKNDFMTETDLEAENAVIAYLKKQSPGFNIISEESPEIGGESEYTWIIDPLDATANFIHGYPVVAVSIGLMKHGERIAGVVYDPLREELFAAQKGQGALLNGEPIEVTKRQSLDGSLIGTGFPLRYKSHLALYLDCFKAAFEADCGIRRDGCAALNLCYVACGRFDGFWEFLLRPWDLAAGSLILEEAGGKISDFAGTSGFMESGNVIAGNPFIHAEMRRLLAPILSGKKITRT